jgi:hypothetical protein
MNVLIAHGLLASDRQFTRVPVNDVLDHLMTHNDCFERTLPATGGDETSKRNRVYVDVDGSIPLSDGMTEDEFVALTEYAEQQLKAAFEPWEHAAMKSHGYNLITTTKDKKTNATKVSEPKHKISFRFHFKKLYGSREAIKAFVEREIEPRVKTATQVAAVDYSVYSTNRKMRMWGSVKPGENQDRPLELIHGEVLDTIITHIPDDAVMLPEPEPVKPAVKPKPKTQTPAVPQNLIVSEMPDGDDVRVKVLTNVSAIHYESYEDWLTIGAICFNENLGLGLWESLTLRNYPSYTLGSKRDCAEKWATFKPSHGRRVTIATAWKWLKTDNPELWSKLMSERQDFTILVNEDNHYDIAKYFYNLKPNAYVNHPSLGWFELQPNNIWRNWDKTPLPLMNDVAATFKQLVNEHIHRVDASDAEGQEKIKKLIGFAKHIGNATWVKGVIEFLTALYYDDNLPMLMDESINLFAFKNCVFDCETGTTRPIVPTDYISNNTKYDLPPREHVAGVIRELTDIFHTMFEDDTTEKWWINTIAKTLYGRNSDNRFYVWTGRGGNGKSLALTLIKNTLGDYYHSFSASILTGVSDKKDAPLPALAKSKGKRFAAATEPDDSSGHFQASTVKLFTGQDEVRCRDLHKSDITFTPQFTLFVACNDVPTYPKIDEGVIRRTRVLRFPFRFTDTPTADWHRQRDATLQAKFERDETYAQAFAWLLMDSFNATRDTRCDEPLSVKEATQDEIDNNLPVKSWLREHYDTNADPKMVDNRVKASELLNEYNSQFEGAARANRMSAAVFKAQVEATGLTYKRLGDARYFIGLKKLEVKTADPAAA